MSTPAWTPPQMPAPEGIHQPHQEPGRLARHASPVSLLVLTAIVSLGASGLLGHPKPHLTTQDGEARLSVEMPSIIRTGDFYETRFKVLAKQDIGELQIEVPASLWREVTVNSMLPAPESETFDDGRFRFTFKSLDAGKEFVFKVASQLNPRLHGKLEGTVRVLDGERLLVESDRSMRVLP
ncbi:conserved hypothetical protein [Burkholderiales bacterium 8X]|nr:conserved hypothetical protein [Burkholderiales bacterium 8X]